MEISELRDTLLGLFDEVSGLSLPVITNIPEALIEMLCTYDDGNASWSHINEEIRCNLIEWLGPQVEQDADGAGLLMSHVSERAVRQHLMGREVIASLTEAQGTNANSPTNTQPDFGEFRA